MSKQHQSDRKKATPLELGAISLNGKKRIDITAYQEKYPGKKFCVINDMDGDVQKYIDAGFDAVEVTTRSERHFKGLTDRNTGEWARWVVGTNEGGQAMHAYLLMIDKDAYQKIIIDPVKRRNLEIRNAMGTGKASASDRDGSNLETYAANLPTGGQGIDIQVPEFNKLS